MRPHSFRPTFSTPWGKSSLGASSPSKSDRGLVAFEFANPDGNAVRELQARFPDVVLTERPAVTAETIAALARLVDHPDQDPGIRARYPRHRLREESLGAAAANPGGHDDELRRGRRADGHARCPRCDDGDRQQHPGDPDPMPPRREEGWLALRLPLGLDAQARAARARAKEELKAEAGVSGRRPATIVDDESELEACHGNRERSALGADRGARQIGGRRVLVFGGDDRRLLPAVLPVAARPTPRTCAARHAWRRRRRPAFAPAGAAIRTALRWRPATPRWSPMPAG